MTLFNHPQCGERGRLSDGDIRRLMNLPRGTSIMAWDNQELTCTQPRGHGREEHVQFLTEQNFGKGPGLLWWASWDDIEGLWDTAVMFTGPICDATHRDFEGVKRACTLLAGHTTNDDQRHDFQ
ncbi:hypothetical protein [Streptomyces griseus]|uniref:hypothetical protein n=1 Tax=Streptomyces griseus TaxID=1911 RepID=UPI00370018A6